MLRSWDANRKFSVQGIAPCASMLHEACCFSSVGFQSRLAAALSASATGCCVGEWDAFDGHCEGNCLPGWTRVRALDRTLGLPYGAMTSRRPWRARTPPRRSEAFGTVLAVRGEPTRAGEATARRCRPSPGTSGSLAATWKRPSSWVAFQQTPLTEGICARSGT